VGDVAMSVGVRGLNAASMNAASCALDAGSPLRCALIWPANEAEGKSRTEAMRCLKRHLARRYHRLLRVDSPSARLASPECAT